MGRIAQYRAELRARDVACWQAYLLAKSGLPGPRGNIELAQALADEADQPFVEQLLATGDEYLVFCGVIGLGRFAAETVQLAGSEPAGSEPAGSELVGRLRGYAADPRWRVREAVAMALQRLGDADPGRLLDVVAEWVRDPHPLVQRAAVAGLCEPRLLVTAAVADAAVDLCARATDALAARSPQERTHPDVRTLRQALGYCWSVAVAATPATGLPRFVALAAHHDRDVAWIVRENRRKARLARLL